MGVCGSDEGGMFKHTHFAQMLHNESRFKADRPAKGEGLSE